MMKTHRPENLLQRLSSRVILLVVISCLMPSWEADATAPRVAQPLFGEDSQADVVGYRAASTGSSGKMEGELIVALVTAVFQAGGVQPIIDILPSKQLAHYEFVVNEVPALIVGQQDMTAQFLARSHQIVFYLKGAADSAEPVRLIFGEKSPRARELYHAFDKGLRTIVENGRYLEVVQQYLGAGGLPSGTIGRLKRLNPGWK